MKFNLEEVIETLNSEKLSLNFNRNTIFRFVTYKKKKLPHLLQKILKRWKLPHHFLYKIDTNINFFINKYCFGDFLSIIKRDNPDLSIIEVFMFDEINYKSSFNNLTWMNIGQIKEHLSLRLSRIRRYSCLHCRNLTSRIFLSRKSYKLVKI